MTEVLFHRLDEPDRVEGICRLLLRRGRLSPPVLIYCPDEDTLARIDERLWTIDPGSFLAHAPARDPERDRAQPILLACKIVRTNAPQVLINASLEVPPDLSGFRYIVDFVDGWDEKLVEIARARWRTYRMLGLAPRYLAGAAGQG